MRLKHFVTYSLIYIGIVGIFVFLQNANSYTISFLGLNLTLPVALWVILPLVLFVIFAIFHNSYVAFCVYKKNKALKNDKALYDEFAKNALLGINKTKSFKTDTFDTAKSVAIFLSPLLKDEVDIKNKQIKDVIEILKLLESGEVVELRKYKITNNNPLFIKNELNKLNLDPKYATEILKNKSEINDELSKKAFDVLLKNCSYFEIKKHNFKLTKFDAIKLVDRYLSDETFEMTKEDFYSLILLCEFDTEQYIKLANSLKAKFSPDALIAMFNRLRSEKDEANEAYLYLLYEFGMIDALKEFINYNDGYDKFKILLFLKDSGRSIPASYMFND
ncbi:hypothetical protein F1B92_05655 [Campylobacter sp. FMV-PI01]|uniref:Uroporphyrinogen III synthase HEM4 n=1 Tax=Campylobacter portucalensis TaxID=2608384 RepID=A0A6L5WHY1_9BACT|nr:hypothetical protein [Campylobacter portucalensis]MSN96654.1 hypothetical protein [Campylobacter portucalensis]